VRLVSGELLVRAEVLNVATDTLSSDGDPCQPFPLLTRPATNYVAAHALNARTALALRRPCTAALAFAVDERGKPVAHEHGTASPEIQPLACPMDSSYAA